MALAGLGATTTALALTGTTWIALLFGAVFFALAEVVVADFFATTFFAATFFTAAFFTTGFLAAAFGWALPMAYVAAAGAPDIWCWLLFAAYMCWTIAYDTQYAMADRDDDLKIGVKSTAILFGRYDVVIIAILQTLFLLLMGAVLWHYFAPTSLGITPVFGLALVAMLFAKQNAACASRQATACFQAFLANIWVGRYVFVLVAVSCLWTSFNG